MVRKSTKESVTGVKEGEAPQGAEEKAPWEVTDASEQEMTKFEAPPDNQWRRPLGDRELLEWVANQAKHNSQDPLAFAESAFAQVAAAESLDASLGGGEETLKGRLTLDVILECNNIKILLGTMAEGCPYFGLLDVRNSKTNEADPMSVGGWLVMAQLGRMHYQSVVLPAGSGYLVAPDTPKAWPKESYPHYFKIKSRPTPKGEMKYLDRAMS